MRLGIRGWFYAYALAAVPRAAVRWRGVPSRLAVHAACPLPQWCRLLERSLAVDGKGWLVGSTLTIADLKLVHWFDKLTNGSLTGIPTDLLHPFPALIAWREQTHRERAARIRQ